MAEPWTPAASDLQRGEGMSMHALRLTGTHTEPSWLHGARTAPQAGTRALSRPDDTNEYVIWAMAASLHLHAALPHIADADAAEHARAAVVALDNMIKALQHRVLPGGGSAGRADTA